MAASAGDLLLVAWLNRIGVDDAGEEWEAKRGVGEGCCASGSKGRRVVVDDV